MHYIYYSKCESILNYYLFMIYVRIGENQNEAFAKVNPFKVLPTIEEDGYMLFESAAILTYVAEKYNLPDHWYPKDLKQRGKVDQYLHWHHSHTRGLAKLFFPKVCIGLIF